MNVLQDYKKDKMNTSITSQVAVNPTATFQNKVPLRSCLSQKKTQNSNERIQSLLQEIESVRTEFLNRTLESSARPSTTNWQKFWSGKTSRRYWEHADKPTIIFHRHTIDPSLTGIDPSTGKHSEEELIKALRILREGISMLNTEESTPCN
jgi:hypothetical protein